MLLYQNSTLRIFYYPHRDILDSRWFGEFDRNKLEGAIQSCLDQIAINHPSQIIIDLSDAQYLMSVDFYLKVSEDFFNRLKNNINIHEIAIIVKDPQNLNNEKTIMGEKRITVMKYFTSIPQAKSWLEFKNKKHLLRDNLLKITA